MLRIELEDLIMIFSLNVAFPWKICSRRYWSTEPHQTKSLNDVVCFNLRESNWKKTVLRELSRSIIEKFNGFKIVRVEFSKKLRQPFCPVDIIYKPVKNCDEIINCYFSEKMNAAFRASFSVGTKIKYCAAWPCELLLKLLR